MSSPQNDIGSGSRDENRPSALVAFAVTGAGGGPALQATIRAILAAVGLHKGRIVRVGEEGEPRVADFRDVSRAFAFARETLRMASRYNERHTEAPLEVRIGMHRDTVWFVGSDVIGDALAVAVHLAGQAAPGTLAVSADALSSYEGSSAWVTEERGSANVQGVERPIDVVEAKPRPEELAAERPSAEVPPTGPRQAPQEPPPAWASSGRGGVGTAGTTARPDWLNIPLPPKSPSARTPGQEIVAGLTEIGRAVVSELAERSKGITEEKVREAIRHAAREQRHGHRNSASVGEPGETEDGDEEGIERPRGPDLPADFLEQKKKRTSERARKALVGFVSHLTSYVLVIGGLLALNLTVGGSYPWAYFPAAGWGIGLLCHWGGVVRTRRKARRLGALEAVSPEQLRLVERIQRAESGFGGHATAYLAVNGFLLGTNLITSWGYPWFLFPAVAWGIGFAIHGTTYLARKAALIGQLREAGLSWRDIRRGKRVSGGQTPLAAPSPVTPTMEHFKLVREARGIRDALLRQLGEHQEAGDRMGTDVAELLATYVEQLEKLVLRNDEFRKTLGSLPEAELEREIAGYREKVTGTEHASLRSEYQKAMEQAERQLKSVRELRHQKEILGVRIQSAFGLLKQLEIDFVRLKNAGTSDEVQGLASIRSKSHELSDYLDGLTEVEGEG